jgi:hypothetical protein
MSAPAPGRLPAFAGSLSVAVLLALGIVALLAAVLAASGFDVSSALTALVRGAAGSSYAVFSATLVRATPLILTGLAVALAFQGGILTSAPRDTAGGGGGRVGGGAGMGRFVRRRRPGPRPGRRGGCRVRAGLAVPAWLKRRFGVLEVISTIMMNFVALYGVGYLVRGPLQEPTRIYPQSSSLPAATQPPDAHPGDAPACRLRRSRDRGAHRLARGAQHLGRLPAACRWGQPARGRQRRRGRCGRRQPPGLPRERGPSPASPAGWKWRG